MASLRIKIFIENVTFVSSDDIVALVLAKPDAIQEWRDVIGHPNPIRAKQEAPHTLRAAYGHDQTRNGLHGSDSYLSAEREIKFIFPEGAYLIICLQKSPISI